MLTFNIVAPNGNYYRGHKPSNKWGNCWGDAEDALVFTLDQARMLCRSLLRGCRLEISLYDTPIDEFDFNREQYCLLGGKYFDFKGGKKMELDVLIDPVNYVGLFTCPICKRQTCGHTFANETPVCFCIDKQFSPTINSNRER